jgi:predicted short-subunit dehydrogenase-like oxidoreductase (DUF2520 family)
VLGTALAIRLGPEGLSIKAVSSRSLSSARHWSAWLAADGLIPDKQSVVDNADLIFITTPDDVIPEIVNQVRWHKGQCVVHCSGADSLDVLEPARIIGARVGSFHPLQTFASIQKAIENLPGSTFALEADGFLLDILKKMAEDLEGRWIRLGSGDKAAYHAGAVMTSN